MNSRSLRATAVILAVAIGGMLSGCTSAEVAPIESVTFRQSKAVMDFDGSQYTTTDEDDIAKLTAILEEHEVTGDYTSRGEPCPGSTSTHLQYTTTSGSPHTLEIGGCDLTDFEEDVTDLVDQWRMARSS